MAGTNPRAARIAALIQRVIASSMEAQLHDKRLTNVTITEVRVTNDLQIAKVYWTQLGREGHEQGERRRAQPVPASQYFVVQKGMHPLFPRGKKDRPLFFKSGQVPQ